MSWASFLIILLVVYILYYAIIIATDVIGSRSSNESVAHQVVYLKPPVKDASVIVDPILVDNSTSNEFTHRPVVISQPTQTMKADAQAFESEEQVQPTNSKDFNSIAAKAVVAASTFNWK